MSKKLLAAALAAAFLATGGMARSADLTITGDGTKSVGATSATTIPGKSIESAITVDKDGSPVVSIGTHLTAGGGNGGLLDTDKTIALSGSNDIEIDDTNASSSKGVGGIVSNMSDLNLKMQAIDLTVTGILTSELNAGYLYVGNDNFTGTISYGTGGGAFTVDGAAVTEAAAQIYGVAFTKADGTGANLALGTGAGSGISVADITITTSKKDGEAVGFYSGNLVSGAVSIGNVAFTGTAADTNFGTQNATGVSMGDIGGTVNVTSIDAKSGDADGTAAGQSGNVLGFDIGGIAAGGSYITGTVSAVSGAGGSTSGDSGAAIGGFVDGDVAGILTTTTITAESGSTTDGASGLAMGLSVTGGVSGTVTTGAVTVDSGIADGATNASGIAGGVLIGGVVNGTAADKLGTVTIASIDVESGNSATDGSSGAAVGLELDSIGGFGKVTVTTTTDVETGTVTLNGDTGLATGVSAGDIAGILTLGGKVTVTSGEVTDAGTELGSGAAIGIDLSDSTIAGTVNIHSIDATSGDATTAGATGEADALSIKKIGLGGAVLVASTIEAESGTSADGDTGDALGVEVDQVIDGTLTFGGGVSAVSGLTTASGTDGGNTGNANALSLAGISAGANVSATTITATSGSALGTTMDSGAAAGVLIDGALAGTMTVSGLIDVDSGTATDESGSAIGFGVSGDVTGKLTLGGNIDVDAGTGVVLTGDAIGFQAANIKPADGFEGAGVSTKQIEATGNNALGINIANDSNVAGTVAADGLTLGGTVTATGETSAVGIYAGQLADQDIGFNVTGTTTTNPGTAYGIQTTGTVGGQNADSIINIVDNVAIKGITNAGTQKDILLGATNDSLNFAIADTGANYSQSIVVDGAENVTFEESSKTVTLLAGSEFAKSKVVDIDKGADVTLTSTAFDATTTEKTINDGTLTLNGAQTLYNLQGEEATASISTNGVLTAMNRDLVTGDDLGDTAYVGTISGTGSLVKDGAGELILSGTNTYAAGTTVTNGRLVATNVNALGTGNTINNSELEFDIDKADSDDYTKAITGTGKVIKTGDGDLYLTNVGNIYSGGTDIDEGKLFVKNGSSTGTGLTSVATGATFGTAGTGGILNGALDLDEGSYLEIGAQADGTASTLNANGQAIDIDEDAIIMLDPNLEKTDNLVTNIDITKVTQNGAAMDAFDLQDYVQQFDVNDINHSVELDYDASTGTITGTNATEDTRYDQYQKVLNGLGAGDAMDMNTEQSLDVLSDAANLRPGDLLGLTTEEAYVQTVLSGLSGSTYLGNDLTGRGNETYAGTQWLNGMDNASSVEAVQDTVRDFTRAISSRAYNLGHMIGANEYDECGNLIANCNAKSTRIWAGYSGLWGKRDQRQFDRGYKYDAHGFNLGVDHMTTSGVAFGAAFGYSKGDFERRGALADDSKINNYSFALYGSYTHTSGFFTTLVGSYTYSKYKMNNQYSTLGNNSALGWDRANYHSDTWSVGGSLGYDIRPAQNLTITPTLGLYYYNTRTNTFNTNLRDGMRYHRDLLEMPLDVTVKYDIPVGCDSKLSLIANAGYAYNFHNKGVGVSSFYIPGSNKLVAGGRDVKPGRSSWNVGGGAQFTYRNFDVGVHYEYYGRNDYKSHSVNANIGMSF